MGRFSDSYGLVVIYAHKLVGSLARHKQFCFTIEIDMGAESTCGWRSGG
jgi:hypothetical protein